MADWQIRRFVPDSDEEDETLSTQSVDDAIYPQNTADDGLGYIEGLNGSEAQRLPDKFGEEEHGEHTASLEESVTGHHAELGHSTEAAVTGVVVLQAADNESEDELALPPPKFQSPSRLVPIKPLDQLFSDTSLPAENMEMMDVDADNIGPDELLPQTSGEQQAQPRGLQSSSNAAGEPTGALSTTFSVPSSPLTEPSSSPSLGFSPAPSPHAEVTINRLNSHPHVEMEQITATQAPTNKWSFRARRQEQLQPFTVDYARHTVEWQSKGLKPIRFEHSGPSPRHRQQRREESHDESYEGEDTQAAKDQTGQDTTPESWMINTSTPVNRAVVRIEQPVASSSFAVGAGGSIQKRRKLKHDYSLKRKDKEPSKHTVPAHFVEQNPMSPLHLSPVEMDWEVPPSPPSSARTHSASAHVENGFRFPRGMTPPQPNQLQTPILTSEPRSAAARSTRHDLAGSANISEHEDSTNPDILMLDTANCVNSISDGGSPTSSDEDNEEEQPPESEQEVEMQKARRRMKGVLPASWLRFDQKTQHKKNSTSHEHHHRKSDDSPTKAQAGVARRIVSHQPLKSPSRAQQAIPLLISDDDASDSDEHPLRRTESGRVESVTIEEDLPAPLLIDDDEPMEDNSFDRMVPAITSGRNLGHKREKKRLEHRDQQPRVPRERGHERTRQTKISNHVKRKRALSRPSAKKTRNLLSIVDVVDVDDARTGPDFLRIAARTAKARNDQGRHSPSRKILKLATREDTAELHQTLNQWKKNKVPKPANSVSRQRTQTQSRLPLKGVSGNGRRHMGSRDGVALESRLIRVAQERQGVRETIQDILKQTKSGYAKQMNNQSRTALAQREDQRIKAVLSSNLRAPVASVPALLEEPKGPRRSRAGKGYNQANSSASALRSVQNPMLERFLEPSSPPGETAMQDNLPASDVHDVSRGRILGRKRPPRQLRITSPGLQQNAQVNHDYFADTTTTESAPLVQHDGKTLTDLAPYGSEYTLDFDVRSLPSGSYFQQPGLLGGDLSRWITQSLARDLSKPREMFVFSFRAATYQWSAWTETVSSELCGLLELFQERMGISQQPDMHAVNKLDVVLRHLADYVSGNLFFLDQVDRTSFVLRFADAISTVHDSLIGIMASSDSGTAEGVSSKNQIYEALSLLSVLAWQLHLVAEHAMVPNEQQTKTRELLEKCLQITLQATVVDGISDFSKFLRAVHDFASLDSVSQTTMSKIESFVTCLQLEKYTRAPVKNFWSTLNQSTTMSVPRTVHSARVLEQKWFNLFMLLPFFDVDIRGTVGPDTRYNSTNDNWPFIITLLEPVLEACRSSSTAQSQRINEYVRASLARCLHLIRGWKWKRPEALLRKLYDFFSTNNLGDLYNEHSHGSPKFLESLDVTPDFSYHPGDRAFHIFLKILASGLQSMQTVLPDKRIQSTVFRLTPNHSRSLPKDEALRQEDLAALRNHHSLLTVLYYASPAGRRPRLDTLRHLVPIEDSHREACQINIRAWSNLVTYQLTQDGSGQAFEEFMSWYNEFLSQAIRLHKLARSEVEEHSAAMTEEAKERHIATNQRHIEAIIMDALDALRKAIQKASTPDYKNTLLTVSLRDVLDLFDPRNARLNGMLINVLDILMIFLKRNEIVNENNDDSQDYGEWPSFDDDGELGYVSVPKTDLHLPSQLYQACHNLLSNAFGSEVYPNDTLLSKAVETWVKVAHYQVTTASKSWDNYIGPYGQDSWANLRSTVQTLLYTPMFLAQLVESDPDIYDDHRSAIFQAWITSLVVRESQLKYQNLLTNAMLNHREREPLLENLPFAKTSDGKFTISIDELRARRLALLSSILSNMHDSLESMTHLDLAQKAERRHQYADLLKVLMRTMKETYESLGRGPDVRGAYVEFVQTIVSFLQQYTATIQPVDRFFTDARTFPLPANDPTYVVGRLKSYGLKIHDTKGAKQLVIFIQNVIERAVIDGQEDYLVDQFQTAISHMFEGGDPTKPTLRSYLVQIILPAYSETVLSTSCGWLLAMPLYRSLQGMLDTILLHLDGSRKDSLQAVLSILSTILSCIQGSASDLVDHLDQTRILRVLTVYVAIVTATLRPLDYCLRLDPTASSHARERVLYLQQFAQFVLGVLDQTYAQSVPDYDEPDMPLSSAAASSARLYATSELKATLSRNWIQDGEGYVFVGNKGRKIINIHLGDLEVEKKSFKLQVELFEQQLERLPSFAQQRRPPAEHGVAEYGRGMLCF